VRRLNRNDTVIGMLVAVVLAGLAYGICAALGLPTSVALVSGLLVLLAGLPSAGFGLGDRRSRI
jgi:hypothetical protein